MTVHSGLLTTSHQFLRAQCPPREDTVFASSEGLTVRRSGLQEVAGRGTKTGLRAAAHVQCLPTCFLVPAPTCPLSFATSLIGDPLTLWTVPIVRTPLKCQSYAP